MSTIESSDDSSSSDDQRPGTFGETARRLRSQTRQKQHERRLFAQVNRRPDVLWQENPPRVLAYRASAVHRYGWIPLNPLNWRNVKASVFGSWLIHAQTAALLGWVAILHTSGLGLINYDLHGFLKIWGTVYAGSVFNLATVVVFILGLFTTLVINRWWSIRTAHTKLTSTCTALAMQAAHTIRDVQQLSNPQVNRARTELVRLVNLAHVLVCMAADGQNAAFAKRRSPAEIQKVMAKARRRLQRRRERGGKGDGDSGAFARTMGTLGFSALQEEGLVNVDEWEQILTNETYGMPRYLTVMYWVEALLHQCRAADMILTPQQMLPSLLNKVSVIIDSANTVFTFIRSQLPYPYVQLVSFTVHFYLFFWATYVGCMLHAGVPDGSLTRSGELDVADFDDPSSSPQTIREARAYLEGRNSQLTVRPPHSVDSWFNGVWLYVTVAFANVIFQGLLSMHALLDNPYGDHCCKFPLRAQVTEVLNTTRTLLCKADVLPSMFSDIFESNSPSSQAPQRAHSAAAQGGWVPQADARASAFVREPNAAAQGTNNHQLPPAAAVQAANAILHATQTEAALQLDSKHLTLKRPSQVGMLYAVEGASASGSSAKANPVFMEKAKSGASVSPFSPKAGAEPRSGRSPAGRRSSESHLGRTGERTWSPGESKRRTLRDRLASTLRGGGRRSHSHDSSSAASITASAATRSGVRMGPQAAYGAVSPPRSMPPSPLQPPQPKIGYTVRPPVPQNAPKDPLRQISLHDVMWHSTMSSMAGQSDELPQARHPRRRFEPASGIPLAQLAARSNAARDVIRPARPGSAPPSGASDLPTSEHMIPYGVDSSSTAAGGNGGGGGLATQRTADYDLVPTSIDTTVYGGPVANTFARHLGFGPMALSTGESAEIPVRRSPLASQDVGSSMGDAGHYGGSLPVSYATHGNTSAFSTSALELRPIVQHTEAPDSQAEAPAAPDAAVPNGSADAAAGRPPTAPRGEGAPAVASALRNPTGISDNIKLGLPPPAMTSTHSTDAGSFATTDSSGNAGSFGATLPRRRSRSLAATAPSIDGRSDSFADSVTVTLQGGGGSGAGRLLERDGSAATFVPPPSLAQLGGLPPPQAGAIEEDASESPPEVGAEPPLPPLTETSQDDAAGSAALLVTGAHSSEGAPAAARGSQASKGSWFKMFGAGRRGTGSAEEAPPRHASVSAAGSGGGASAAGEAFFEVHSEVAGRRVGAQSVFNPNVILNADDAEFLQRAAAAGGGDSNGGLARSAASSIAQPASLGGAAGALPLLDGEAGPPGRPESRGGGSGGTGDGSGSVGGAGREGSVRLARVSELRQPSYNPQMPRPGDVSNGS